MPQTFFGLSHHTMRTRRKGETYPRRRGFPRQGSGETLALIAAFILTMLFVVAMMVGNPDSLELFFG